jgi:hypothetical protein
MIRSNRDWSSDVCSSDLLYNLPFGKGRHFGASMSPVLNQMFGGWRIATLGILHTGIANTVFIGTNTYGNSNFTNQRPNWVGGAPLYPEHQTVNNFLNSAPYGMPAAGTFGNLGRNTINGPSFVQLDLSFLKTFTFKESRTLEYRFEIFNVPNHPNFGQPNTTYGTANFGRIFDTFGRTLGIGTSRQIQMALKFNF